jgi:hypothetical protein
MGASLGSVKGQSLYVFGTQDGPRACSSSHSQGVNFYAGKSNSVLPSRAEGDNEMILRVNWEKTCHVS